MERLTLNGDVQIYFGPEGRPEFSSRAKLPAEAVEHLVYEWQSKNPSHPRFTFSEKWIEAFDAPDPIKEQKRFYRKFFCFTQRHLLESGLPVDAAEEEARKITEAVMEVNDPDLFDSKEWAESGATGPGAEHESINVVDWCYAGLKAMTSSWPKMKADTRRRLLRLSEDLLRSQIAKLEDPSYARDGDTAD